MAQEPIKIKEHIDAERERLGHDIEEIEYRMKDAFDWRSWYESNTVIMLGAAAAGGFLVSVLVDRGESDHDEDSNRYGVIASTPSSTGTGTPSLKSRVKSEQLSRLAQVLENTFAALVGVGAAKFQDYVSEVVPGFREKYQEAEGHSNR